jgi:magnesium-transporting ATPase (P-type)
MAANFDLVCVCCVGREKEEKEKEKEKKERIKKEKERKKKIFRFSLPYPYTGTYWTLSWTLSWTHTSPITRHQVAFTLSQGQRIVLFSCVIVKNILLFYTLSMQYIIRLQMYVYSIFYCINFTIFLHTVPEDELLYSTVQYHSSANTVPGTVQ